jgi:TPR repeat protein
MSETIKNKVYKFSPTDSDDINLNKNDEVALWKSEVSPNDLGVLYLQGGGGVEKNPLSAYQLFKIATREFNDSAAMLNLSRMYEVGFPSAGIHKNPEKALHYLKKSALLNHPVGMYNLAHHYLENNELSKAEKWFMAAASAGDEDAAHNLALLQKMISSK